MVIIYDQTQAYLESEYNAIDDCNHVIQHTYKTQNTIITNEFLLLDSLKKVFCPNLYTFGDGVYSEGHDYLKYYENLEILEWEDGSINLNPDSNTRFKVFYE